jgi:hypothetical protein
MSVRVHFEFDECGRRERRGAHVRVRLRMMRAHVSVGCVADVRVVCVEYTFQKCMAQNGHTPEGEGGEIGTLARRKQKKKREWNVRQPPPCAGVGPLLSPHLSPALTREMRDGCTHKRGSLTCTFSDTVCNFCVNISLFTCKRAVPDRSRAEGEGETALHLGAYTLARYFHSH